MWHQLQTLFLDFWRRWCQRPEIQKTILQEQSEYIQPELVEIELSTVTSESPQTTANDTPPALPARRGLRINIPRELGQSV